MAQERVDGMWNGTSFAMCPVAGLEVAGGGRFMRADTGVNNELEEIRGFMENDRGWFVE